MKYLKPLIGSAVLIGLMFLASAWVWPRLGDHPLAIHFDMNGQPNGYGPKAEALLASPILASALTLLFAVLPPLMPAKARLERSWGAYTTMWLAVLTFLLLLHLAMLAHDLGTPIAMSRISLVGMGLLFAVLGNLLGKVRYNYVFGVRTPWTLSSERVWDRTHRFAGWAMVLGGLVAVAVGVFAPMEADAHLKPVLLACVLGPALASVIYSYAESRRIEGEA